MTRICSPFLFPVLCLLPMAIIPDTVSAGETVIVGVYNNSPKIFLDENGEPAGIFIDIIEEIASREGWELRYVQGSWSEGLERLEAGEIDLMPDVAYSTARAELFDFHSEPVLSDWFHVYALKGSGIRSIVDLENRRIAVLERSVQMEAFLNLADDFALRMELVPMPDYATIFQKVADGEVDAAITNRFYGMSHAEEYRLEDTAIIFSPTRLFYATARGRNRHLLDAIDANLAAMKNDAGSVYYSSLRRWTSEPLGFRFAGWVTNTIYILAGVLLLSLLGSYLLKKQVNSRTADLVKINCEMESRIRERTEDLALAMDKAQSADRIKSAFLAAMSHELRTPLNSIIGFTGILLQKLAGPLNEEQEKQLEMVQKSSRHLLALINDILDISKIEAGELELAREIFDPGEAVLETVNLLGPTAEEKGLELAVSIPDKAQIFQDRRRFQQIAMNLISNAVKFTEKGRVTVSLCSAENAFVLTVADTGPGIPPEHIGLLFRPFQQLDSGLSRLHEGTGLGLSICKRLTDMMKGTISVESTPGRGSVFTVRLPAEQEADLK